MHTWIKERNSCPDESKVKGSGDSEVGLWKSSCQGRAEVCDSADGCVATAEGQYFSERNLLLFLPCRLRGQQKTGHTSEWRVSSLFFILPNIIASIIPLQIFN